jgi:hypothetical protein
MIYTAPVVSWPREVTYYVPLELGGKLVHCAEGVVRGDVVVVVVGHTAQQSYLRCARLEGHVIFIQITGMSADP